MTYKDRQAVCSDEHDPTPMSTVGIAMAQATFGNRKYLDPRQEFCQKVTHYTDRATRPTSRGHLPRNREMEWA